MVFRFNNIKHWMVLLGFSLAVAAGISVGQELTEKNDAHVFSTTMSSIEKLTRIKFLLINNQTQLQSALINASPVSAATNKLSLVLNRTDTAKALDLIDKNLDVINNLQSSLERTFTATEAKELSDKFNLSQSQYLEQGLKPAKIALQKHNYVDTKNSTQLAAKLLEFADNDIDSLIKSQLDTLQHQYLNILPTVSTHELATEASHDLATVAPVRPIEKPTQPLLLISLLSIGLLAMAMGLVLWMRKHNKYVSSAIHVIEQLIHGRFDNALSDVKTQNINSLDHALHNLQAKIAKDHAECQLEMFNVKQLHVALDALSVGIMIADNQRNITYANKAVCDILRPMEAIIRQRLSNFNVDQLLGINIDVFHKAPAHQANLLSNLTSSFTGEFELGGRHNRIIATPITNIDHERIGTVAEWHDRTGAKTSEQEVIDIINKIQQGDFSQRINTKDKTDFYKQAGRGINSIIDIFDAWIQEILRVFSGIEVGDLTQKIDDDGADAGTFTLLAQKANHAVDTLQDMIVQIRIASESINTAAREMAEGNTDLSQRTEEQAASLEETAASMEQLAVTVKTNADNAKQANQMAVAATNIAEKGGLVVKNVVQTMSSINESSRKIVDIISVIDGIAFQTNILALNAAVEAARAGGQGRGFAVVAGEVRILAQKSAAAAKEIKQLISDSVIKVDMGSKLVTEAGSTMDEIVSSVHRVSEIMDEISAASIEQSSGIDQVNLAITQMDEVTQQNASLVEESAAAANALDEQAQSLNNSVGAIKLSSDMLAAIKTTPVLLRPSLKTMTKKSTSHMKMKPSAASSNDDWEEF